MFYLKSLEVLHKHAKLSLVFCDVSQMKPVKGGGSKGHYVIKRNMHCNYFIILKRDKKRRESERARECVYFVGVMFTYLLSQSSLRVTSEPLFKSILANICDKMLIQNKHRR